VWEFAPTQSSRFAVPVMGSASEDRSNPIGVRFGLCWELSLAIGLHVSRASCSLQNPALDIGVCHLMTVPSNSSCTYHSARMTHTSVMTHASLLLGLSGLGSSERAGWTSGR
jgi:hypothetical protein